MHQCTLHYVQYKFDRRTLFCGGYSNWLYEQSPKSVPLIIFRLFTEARTRGVQQPIHPLELPCNASLLGAHFCCQLPEEDRHSVVASSWLTVFSTYTSSSLYLWLTCLIDWMNEYRNEVWQITGAIIFNSHLFISGNLSDHLGGLFDFIILHCYKIAQMDWVLLSLAPLGRWRTRPQTRVKHASGTKIESK